MILILFCIILMIERHCERFEPEVQEANISIGVLNIVCNNVNI